MSDPVTTTRRGHLGYAVRRNRPTAEAQIIFIAVIVIAALELAVQLLRMMPPARPGAQFIIEWWDVIPRVVLQIVIIGGGLLFLAGASIGRRVFLLAIIVWMLYSLFFFFLLHWRTAPPSFVQDLSLHLSFSAHLLSTWVLPAAAVWLLLRREGDRDAGTEPATLPPLRAGGPDLTSSRATG